VFVSGEWIWKLWQELPAHDKKAVYALIASVHREKLKVICPFYSKKISWKTSKGHSI
jgi:hypothetical protein